MVVSGFMLPYFGVVFYLALKGPDSVSRMPGCRWGMLIYFVVGIILFGVGGRFFKAGEQKPENKEPLASRIDKSVRSVRKLLVLYLIFFPVGLAEVFLQKELPVGLAILALSVPVLIMIFLWRSLRRLQRIQAQATEGD
jgi:hypothetical protein